jgi:hypothetical protein
MNTARSQFRKSASSKVLWALLIIIFLVIPLYVFFQNRFVGGPQDFGPVDTSSFGGSSPFRQVDLRLTCRSEDGSYLSDLSNIGCQILVKVKNESISSISDMEFGVLIRNSTGQTIITANGTALNIDWTHWATADLTTADGREYFELPRGDYKVSIQQFGIGGGGVIVTKAKPLAFRGILQVISDFDKRTRLSQDGTSLATFLAFLFIIPTTLIEIRSFIFRAKVSSGMYTRSAIPPEDLKIEAEPQTESTRRSGSIAKKCEKERS